MAYDARQIQELLNKFGYGLAVDGNIGPRTQAAIRDFQSKHGLAVDGIVGPNTWGALNGQGGGGGGSASTPAAPAAANAADIYPQYGFLLNDPELGPILRQAAAEGWPANKLQATLENTGWWRNNADSARKYQELANTDPTQFLQTIQQIADQITAIAKRNGIGISPEEIYGLAKAALYTNRLTEANLATFVMTSPHTTFGASPLIDQVTQMAAQYLVPLSQQTKEQWARQLGDGEITTQTLQSYMVEQAKSMFPSLAAAIDQGITVQQYVAPYKQLAAQTLEISPDSINMMDPRWNRALNQIDPKTGQRVSMTLYDWQTLMRTDPQYGYDKTEGARTQGAQLVTQLASKFGNI